MMQIYHFTCKHWGYELKLPLGSSDLDQVLTDVNADYADYGVYVVIGFVPTLAVLELS
jgi:hypothetical protein